MLLVPVRTRPGFAAAVPVAPAGAPSWESIKGLVHRLAGPVRLWRCTPEGVPIWAFHGSNDVIVPSFITAELVQALWQRGAGKDVPWKRLRILSILVASIAKQGAGQNDALR